MTGMEDRVNKALGRLKTVMQTNNWSQTEAATRIGVAQKTLSFWLTGKVNPTAKKIEVIEEFCRSYEKSNEGNNAATKGNEKGNESNNVAAESNRKSNDTRGESISEGNSKSNKGNEKSNRKSNNTNKKSNNDNDELTAANLTGLLIEAQAGKELDEQDKNNQEKYREYYNGKVIALSLEDKNYSRLILFPSLSGAEDEWYKMGGHSALLYKYVVGPRLKKKPVIRKDSDLQHRFKHGIVAVHWGDKFINDVDTIGLRARRIDYGIIVVEMERSYTANEIGEMHKQEKSEQNKVAKIVMPEKNYPDLYGQIRQLVRLLPPKIKKMNIAYREVIGNRALEIMIRLVEVYFQMANGRMQIAKAREEMLKQVDNMMALIVIIDENQLFDVITRARIGEVLVEIKLAIKRRLV